MHEGYYSSLLGLRGAPAEAEAVIVARDVLLAGPRPPQHPPTGPSRPTRRTWVSSRRSAAPRTARLCGPAWWPATSMWLPRTTRPTPKRTRRSSLTWPGRGPRGWRPPWGPCWRPWVRTRTSASLWNGCPRRLPACSGSTNTGGRSLGAGRRTWWRSTRWPSGPPGSGHGPRGGGTPPSGGAPSRDGWSTRCSGATSWSGMVRPPGDGRPPGPRRRHGVSGAGLRGGGGDRRRDRVQHRDEWLPGGADRPVVRRPDRGDDGAARRQLRGQQRRRRVGRRAGGRVRGSGGSPVAEQLAVRTDAGRIPCRGRRRGHRGHRYQGAHAPHPRGRRDAGGDLDRGPRRLVALGPGPPGAVDARRRPRRHGVHGRAVRGPRRGRAGDAARGRPPAGGRARLGAEAEQPPDARPQRVRDGGLPGPHAG